MDSWKSVQTEIKQTLGLNFALHPVDTPWWYDMEGFDFFIENSAVNNKENDHSFLFEATTLLK